VNGLSQVELPTRVPHICGNKPIAALWAGPHGVSTKYQDRQKREPLPVCARPDLCDDQTCTNRRKDGEQLRVGHVFPDKLKGHLRLMESEMEPTHDLPESEPVLEIVEGDAMVPETDKSIVPNAFESVLEKYDAPPKFEDREAPPYKNRAFIAVLFLIAGIVAGRLTTQTQIVNRIIEKDRPVLVPTPSETKTPEAPKVDKAFRDLTNLNEFDPWQPLNGGFPLPPKSTQAAIVSRSSGLPSGVPQPSGLSGRISPLDPSDMGATLPAVGGQGGSNLPLNPLPGGTTDKTKTETGTAAVVGGKEQYVSMSLDGPEPEKGQSSISGIASAVGGTARTFSHMAEDGTVESRGVLVIVPAGKFDEAKTKIAALGGATIDSTYEGVASERQTQIQSPFLSRLAKLQAKRKDLLVDFLDDAQPVKQINEAIDQETRAVSATRLPGNLGGKAVLRITLK